MIYCIQFENFFLNSEKAKIRQKMNNMYESISSFQEGKFQTKLRQQLVLELQPMNLTESFMRPPLIENVILHLSTIINFRKGKEMLDIWIIFSNLSNSYQYFIKILKLNFSLPVVVRVSMKLYAMAFLTVGLYKMAISATLMLQSITGNIMGT